MIKKPMWKVKVRFDGGKEKTTVVPRYPYSVITRKAAQTMVRASLRGIGTLISMKPVTYYI